MMDFIENSWTWIKAHKGGICVTLGLAAGVGAVATTAWKTPAMINAKNEFYDVPVKRLKLNREKGTDENGNVYTEKEYRKDMSKALGKAALEVGKQAIIPTVLEAASIGLITYGYGSEHKERVAATMALGAMTAAYNNLRNSDNGMIEIESKNENGEVEIKKVSTPVPGAIDKKVAEESANGTLPVPAGVFTIKLDEEHPVWKTCNGNAVYMAMAVRKMRDDCNDILWRRGRITMAEILTTLGFDRDRDKDRFDWEMANMVGIIDQTKAYDLLTKQWVDIPGYTSEDRRFGDAEHKSVSFGPLDWDYIYEAEKMPEDYPVGDRTYYYLDINCDGNIANLKIKHITEDGMLKRLEAHPELEK